MGGSNNAAKEANRAEAERREQISATQRRIEQIFADPSREAGIQDVIGATRDYLQGDLDRQTERNQRQLKFATARAGQTFGSVDADRNRDLAEAYLRAGLEVERRAQGAGTSLRQADQVSKQNLFNLATTGIDATTAARQAADAFRVNNDQARQDAMQSGLGDLFGDLGEVYKRSRERAGQQSAEKYQYNTFWQPGAFTGLGSVGW